MQKLPLYLALSVLVVGGLALAATHQTDNGGASQSDQEFGARADVVEQRAAAPAPAVVAPAGSPVVAMATPVAAGAADPASAGEGVPDEESDSVEAANEYGDGTADQQAERPLSHCDQVMERMLTVVSASIPDKGRAAFDEGMEAQRDLLSRACRNMGRVPSAFARCAERAENIEQMIRCNPDLANFEIDTDKAAAQVERLQSTVTKQDMKVLERMLETDKEFVDGREVKRLKEERLKEARKVLEKFGVPADGDSGEAKEDYPQ